MRRTALFVVPAVIVACAKPDAAPPAADTTAAAAMAAAPVSPADFAGNWQVKVMNEAGDSVSGYVLSASADPATWSFTFPGRDPIPARVAAVDGDSIVMEAGPFMSSIRADVEVSTRSVVRLRDGRLTAATVARYMTSGPDSVVTLLAEGVRIP